MEESLIQGALPTRRHLMRAGDHFRAIESYALGQKEAGLVVLREDDGLEFIPLTALRDDRLCDYGIESETAGAIAAVIDDLDTPSEASVLVVATSEDGQATPGLVNLILNSSD